MKTLKCLLLVATVGASPVFYGQSPRYSYGRNYGYTGYQQQGGYYSRSQPFTAFRSVSSPVRTQQITPSYSQQPASSYNQQPVSSIRQQPVASRQQPLSSFRQQLVASRQPASSIRQPPPSLSSEPFVRSSIPEGGNFFNQVRDRFGPQSLTSLSTLPASAQREQDQPASSFRNNQFGRTPGRIVQVPGVGRISVEFANDNRIVNIENEVQEALRVPVVEDPRIKAPKDFSSPNAAAALEYMRQITGKDGLCGIPTEVFLEKILSGESREVANAEATRVYLEAYNRGERLPAGGPCEKADIAWRQAVVEGKDPVVESALVFMDNWPGVREGNPCAVSGVDYVKAILAGKSHLEANRLSVASFAQSFKDLARAGKPVKDKACFESARAFWNAVPVSDKPDPANAKAFLTFAEKIFNGDAPAYDPVCYASLEGFFEAFINGDDLLTANLKSARSFFREFQKGNSRVPADSACAAATLEYAEEIRRKPSPPNFAGMIDYIVEAIKNGERKLDPVCGEATLAYWDAYIDEKSEAAANEAAAVAYLEALDKNPDFDQTSACAKSAEGYIREFNGDFN